MRFGGRWGRENRVKYFNDSIPIRERLESYCLECNIIDRRVPKPMLGKLGVIANN